MNHPFLHPELLLDTSACGTSETKSIKLKSYFDVKVKTSKQECKTINVMHQKKHGSKLHVFVNQGRFLKEEINYTRYNSYSRDKSAILGITIPGIKMGSRKHCLFSG